jgi:hypothetical protein
LLTLIEKDFRILYIISDANVCFKIDHELVSRCSSPCKNVDCFFKGQ